MEKVPDGTSCGLDGLKFVNEAKAVLADLKKDHSVDTILKAIIHLCEVLEVVNKDCAQATNEMKAFVAEVKGIVTGTTNSPICNSAHLEAGCYEVILYLCRSDW